MNTSDIRARIVAVIVGVLLLFFVAFVSDLWPKTSSLILFTVCTAIYGVVGIVVGSVWPSSGWRLGLYLFAVWPPVLAFGTFLAWEHPINDVKGTLMDLLGYLLFLIGGCVGAAFGSVLARRFATSTDHHN